MSTPRYLLRLFDLDPAPEDGTSVAVVPAGVDPQIPNPDVGPVSSGQRGHLIVRRDGQPMAAVALHPWGACSLGRVVTLQGGGDPVAPVQVVHRLLTHLRWSSYEYCLVDELPDDERLVAASVAVPTISDESSLNRDVRELPWGDVFVDLVEHPLPSFPTEVEQPDRTFRVRRPEASEQLLLTQWIRDEFGAGWASEVVRSFASTPITSMIAVEVDDSVPQQRRPVGFICYDSIRRGMLSAIAVRPDLKGVVSQLGGALLSQCLGDAGEQGYGFVVLSGVSRRVAALRVCPGSWTIPGSYPGIFGRGINTVTSTSEDQHETGSTTV